MVVNLRRTISINNALGMTEGDIPFVINGGDQAAGIVAAILCGAVKVFDVDAFQQQVDFSLLIYLVCVINRYGIT